MAVGADDFGVETQMKNTTKHYLGTIPVRNASRLQLCDVNPEFGERHGWRLLMLLLVIAM